MSDWVPARHLQQESRFFVDLITENHVTSSEESNRVRIYWVLVPKIKLN